MTICMRAFTPVLLAAAALLFHSQAHAGYTHYFTWRKVSSDGSWEDWAAGAKLYTSVLRRPARNPMAQSWTAPGSRGIGLALIAVGLLGISIIYWLKRKLGNA